MNTIPILGCELDAERHPLMVSRDKALSINITARSHAINDVHRIMRNKYLKGGDGLHNATTTAVDGAIEKAIKTYRRSPKESLVKIFTEINVSQEHAEKFEQLIRDGEWKFKK